VEILCGLEAHLEPGNWVKAVDGDALRRLTDTPLSNETWAAWV
jgi:hypothetical protein